MKATIASLVQSVAHNVSERLLHGVPRNLDLNYITDRILVMSQCARAPSPTYTDDGRKELVWNNLSAADPNTHGKRKKPMGNSPADVSTFLQNRHDGHSLILSLSDVLPDDRSLLLLRRQLLNWNWQSPGKQNSETPSLSQLLDLCYTIHAYLNVDARNVVVVSCANGKTRSAVVVACYLKFARLAETSLQGFSTFLQHRCPLLDVKQASQHIPPSLIQCFRNFDELMDLGDFANPKPLLLRAVALQGVPVDDKPCLDIWDSQQNHVYSSMSNEDSAQWADEEGFYKVNRILEGDFCLLCRFGGVYANDLGDPSKVLFRYANSTGFLNSGTYEIPKVKVDMMRRYEMSFEEEDFLLTLILESYWDSPNPTPGLDKDSKQFPPIFQGYAALERGWHLLTEHHAAKPNTADFQALRSVFPEVQKCPDHICKVVLQLTNLDLRKARNLLMDGPMKEWWVEGDNEDDTSSMELDNDDEYALTLGRAHPIRPVTPELSCRDILNILDDTSETDTVEPSRRPQHQERDAGIRYEPVLFPNRGDVVDAFGDYSKDLHTKLDRFPPVEPLRPRMPMHKRKRPGAPTRTLHSKKQKNKDETNTDEEREAALQLLEQLNHTGVTLDDLLQLQRAARRLNQPVKVNEESSERGEMPLKGMSPMGTREPAELREAGAEEGEDEDVEGFEVADDDDKPGNNDLFLGFVVKGDKPKADKNPDGEVGEIPLKDDPEYSKYFKMLKMGLSIDMVKHALKRDGKDPDVMDLDHNKSVRSQVEKSTAGDDPPLQQDPLYVKYFKMLKMGLPMDAVKHAMKRDGCDPSVMDLDPEKSLKSQRGGSEEDGPPLRDDPDYSKYFKMLKMGLPMDAVKHSVKRDGKDPSIMDLDPDKSIKSQTKSDAVDDGPPLKDDPEYEKYFKMLKMGLPMGAVKNAVQRDGKDPSIMDLDPCKSIKSQTGGGAGDGKDDGPPLKDDPEYEKYFKMLKMGLPMGAVKNAVQRDGKDPSIMDLDPNRSIKSQTGGGAGDGKDDGPPLKDDPEYEKYFKMLKMGLPMGAVKNAVQRDGKDPSMMDLDPNRSILSQTGGGGDNGEEEKDTGIPLKDDPDFSKYFKMLKMGLPMGAVKNAVQRDGKDSSIMDLDPEKSLSFQLAKKGGGSSRPVARKKVKKRVRRKKIYWTPIDPKKVVEGSLWSIVKGEIDMEKLSYDQTEFENLFTESTNPADKVKKDVASNSSSSKKKEMVQLIDGKRSMNGGIILARLKMPYSQIATMVNIMDAGEFDSTQLMALKEFLPTDEERGALGNYCKDLGSSEEAKEKSISALPACEKYMIAMMEVKNAQAKFDCMLFKVQFHSLLDELVAGIRTVRKACDEVRNSDRLRKMMAMILTLVNQINTGGDGNMALGFSLEALLKLGEAKAFDKKTSVLHYLAKLIRQNDESLLRFGEDLTTVPLAEGVVLDGLVGDMKMVNEQLQKVTETTITEADALEKEGKLPEMSVVTRMKDEDTNTMDIEHSDEPADQSPDVDEKDGTEEGKPTISENSGESLPEGGAANQKARTPMEVFVHEARREVDEALKSLDELKASYSGVLKYFGEDENMQSNEFFGTLQKFIIQFKLAADQVEIIERGRLKEKLKKAVKAAANIKLIGDLAGRQSDSIQDADDSESSPEKLKAAEQGKGLSEGKAAVSSTETKEATEGEQGAVAMGSLAAMAAAAAAKRGKAKTERPDLGGLAAMAAAAASKREQKMAMPANADAGSTIGADTEVRLPVDHSPVEGGNLLRAAADVVVERGRPDLSGLAAMAARVASERHQQGQPGHNEATTVEQDRSTADSVSVLAAAAAAARSEDQQGHRGSNMAALAAEAARKRMEKKSDAPDAGVAATKPSMGDIAGMAAAAALKRTQDRQSIGKTKQPALNQSEQAPNVGKIAMMAAAAATMRTQMNDELPTVGDIAFLATMPATLKSKTGNGEPSGTNLSIGSEVVTAAAGASSLEGPLNVSKDQTAPQDEITLSSPSNVPMLTPIGGIAAMAAAAAVKRIQDQLPRPDIGRNAGVEALEDPAGKAKGSDVVSTVNSTSSHTESGQPSASAGTDFEFSLEMGVGPTPASTQHLEKISDAMKNTVETDPPSYSDALNNTRESPGYKLAPSTTSTTTIFSEPAKKESFVGTTVIEQGPCELSRKAAAKKRSSSEDEGGDDTSSGGESTSSKKLKSSPHLNGDNFQDFEPSKVDADGNFRDDTNKSFSRGDPTLGTVPTGSLPDEVPKSNRHSDDDEESKQSFATAESTEEWVLSKDEVLSSFESKTSNELSLQKSLSSSTENDISFVEDSRKGKGRKSKKKKNQKTVLNEEQGVVGGEQVAPRSSPVRAIGVTTEEKAGIEISRQNFLSSEQEADTRSIRSKKQLSPLRSEKYSPARRLDTHEDDTIERFFVTLDDEVAVASNLHAGKATPSVDQGFPELSVAKPNPRPDQAPITETSHETPTKANNDDKKDVGNPLQRWFQGFGGSRENSDIHASKEKLEEKAPALPPADGNDNDNLFVSIFRQIGGRDNSTKSLPTDPEAPAEQKKS